jgi:hypothetical protein
MKTGCAAMKPAVARRTAQSPGASDSRVWQTRSPMPRVQSVALLAAALSLASAAHAAPTFEPREYGAAAPAANCYETMK